MNEINIKIKQVIDFIFRLVTAVLKGAFNLIKDIKPIQRIQNNPVIIRTGLGLAVSIGLLNWTDAKVEDTYQWILAILVMAGAVSARNVVKPLTKNQKKAQKENRKRKRKEVIQKAKRKVKRNGGNK